MKLQKIMKVTCDKCQNLIVLRTLEKHTITIPTETVETNHVSIYYFRCKKCKSKYFVTVENKEILKLKDKIWKERNPQNKKELREQLKKLVNQVKRQVDLDFFNFVNCKG